MTNHGVNTNPTKENTMGKPTSSQLSEEEAKLDELVEWFRILGTDELERLRIEMIGEEAHLEASKEGEWDGPGEPGDFPA
jgi:hypothetical protein